jgi:hypothetical protein
MLSTDARRSLDVRDLVALTAASAIPNLCVV